MKYGIYRNATAQYTAIEKSLMEAQKKRDDLLVAISDKNSSLNAYKIAILDILNSYEFQKGRIKKNLVPALLANQANLKEGQLEVEKGLVFDPAIGKIKTRNGTIISDLSTFLSNENMGFKCIFTPPNQTSGTGYCPPSYGEMENMYWPIAKDSLISNVNSYRSVLIEIPALKNKLDEIQKKINSLRTDLDAAAKQDPALLKAKTEAAAKEAAAKIAADAELEKLRITKEADAKLKEAEAEAKKKQFNKLLIFGGLGAAAIAAVLILRGK